MLTINQAVHILERGGIVGVPLETVYIEAVSAHNPIACEHLFQKSNFNPGTYNFTHFFSDIQSVSTVFDISNKDVTKILTDPRTRNVSCILPFKTNNGYIPSSRGETFGVCHIPHHPLALELLNSLKKPLVGINSVAKKGIYCTTSRIMQHIHSEIDGIIDGGGSLIGLLPTIVDCTKGDTISIYSRGVVSLQTIKSVIDTDILDHSHSAPYSYIHSSKHTPHIVDSIDELREHCKQTSILLASEEDIEHLPQIQLDCFVLNLGSKKYPTRVAQNLYEHLLQAQSDQIEHIFYLRTSWGSSDIAQAISNTLILHFE